MATAEQVGDTNWSSSFEFGASLIEQLQKAYAELEAQTDTVEGKVRWIEVEQYFSKLQSMYKKKLEELELKKKEFIDRDSKARKMIAEKEQSVSAKEQALLDWIQKLKDDAVAAIGQLRENHTSDFVEHVAGAGNENRNKVSSSYENRPHDAEMPFHNSTLTQICKQMDGKGLLRFMESKSDLSDITEALSIALRNANQPARMVLDALEGFFSSDGATQQGGNRNASLVGMRKSCLIIMEALATLLAKADSTADFILNPEIKQYATAIANNWKPELGVEGIDAASGKSFEIEGLLRLIATFRIASEFDKEELCKFVVALGVAGNRQALELCRSLGLTPKVPDIVQNLIDHGRQIDAVHLIQSFQLSDTFPSVPLLKAHLKDLRRKSQNKGGGVGAHDYNALELAALKAVIACVTEYNLEDDYSLETLYKRVAQLDKSQTDKKRATESSQKQQQPKRPRSNGTPQTQRNRPRGGGPAAGAHGRARHRVKQGTPSQARLPVVYSHAVPSSYSYPNSVQTTAYFPEASNQNSYYYVQGDRQVAVSYDAGPSTYGNMMGSGIQQSSHQPYM